MDIGGAYMSKKKFSGNISGKGYYIALALCLVVVGVLGWFALFGGKEPAENVVCLL